MDRSDKDVIGFQRSMSNDIRVSVRPISSNKLTNQNSADIYSAQLGTFTSENQLSGRMEPERM